MNKNHFFEYLAENFPEQYEELTIKFKQYATLLEEQNKIHNLTALAPEEYMEKHFLDSILLQEIYDFRNETLIDVGTGAGFPGLVLALVFPSLNVTLLEPIKKRVNFLRLVIKELEIANVEIVTERAEDYALTAARETFDLATSRAVASMPILLEISVPLIKDGGSVLVMKGKNFVEELNSANQATYTLKLEIGKTKNHFLPTDGSMRVNCRLIKKGKTNEKYPRSYAQIKKNPL